VTIEPARVPYSENISLSLCAEVYLAGHTHPWLEKIHPSMRPRFRSEDLSATIAADMG